MSRVLEYPDDYVSFVGMSRNMGFCMRLKMALDHGKAGASDACTMILINEKGLISTVKIWMSSLEYQSKLSCSASPFMKRPDLLLMQTAR